MKRTMTHEEEAEWGAQMRGEPPQPKEVPVQNGKLTGEERREALELWFDAGGIVISSGRRFFPTKRVQKAVLDRLANLGIQRSGREIKTTFAFAVELLCAEATIRRIINQELRPAGRAGNINQGNPAAMAVYVRVDEKTAQAIMDGDLRRKKWSDHTIDTIVEAVPSRPEETQPNLAGYVAQARHQIAIVQDLPPRLTGTQQPALPSGKDDDSGAD